MQETPVSSEIKMRKWKWIRQLMREDQNIITRQGLNWNPQGERKKGRQRITRKRTILVELQEQNVLKREETNGKNSPLAKMCYGPMFHLGITGNDDDDDDDYEYRYIYIYIYIYICALAHTHKT
jgi:hypothetical protein